MVTFDTTLCVKLIENQVGKGLVLASEHTTCTATKEGISMNL